MNAKGPGLHHCTTRKLTEQSNKQMRSITGMRDSYNPLPPHNTHTRTHARTHTHTHTHTRTHAHTTPYFEVAPSPSPPPQLPRPKMKPQLTLESDRIQNIWRYQAV